MTYSGLEFDFHIIFDFRKNNTDSPKVFPEVSYHRIKNTAWNLLTVHFCAFLI